MGAWGWEQLQPWLDVRRELPVGPLLCVINGATRGRRWSPAAARAELRRVAGAAGDRRRFAPHQLRHAHAVEMAREGAPLIVIQRQLGHSNLGITSVYLQGHRQRRDHRDRPRPTRADDLGQRLAAALSDNAPGRSSSSKARPRSRPAVHSLRPLMLSSPDRALHRAVLTGHATTNCREGTIFRHTLARAPATRRSGTSMRDSMSRSSGRLRSPGEGHDRRGPRHQETTI